MTQSPPLRKFAGFVPPEKNFFQMPNEWIDICSEIRDISELKVIQYILRHTWGFHEYGICKTISVDEFMQGRRRQDGSRMDKGTGLSEQGVRNGIKQAIDDGYLVSETDASDAGRVKKSYALKMATAELGVQTFDPVQTLYPPQSLESEVQTFDPQVQTLGARGQKFVPRSEKDTIERHYKKDTIERQEREVADATARALFIHPQHSFLAFDDLEHPTEMTIFFEDDDRAEITNKGYDRIAQEVAIQLSLQGFDVKVISAKRHSVETIDDEDTVEREAVKPSQKDVAHGHAHQHPVVDNHFSPGSDQLLPRSERNTNRDTNKITEPPAPRKPRANPTIPKRPRPQQQELTDEIPGPEIPEKAVAIMDRWDRVHRKPAPRTIKTIQAAQLLMVYDPSEDELRECEKWLYTTDRPGKPWYRSHGVHLPDIAEKIGSWQSLQNAPPAKPEKEPSNEHKASSFYTLDAFIERQNQWKTEGVTS